VRFDRAIHYIYYELLDLPYYKNIRAKTCREYKLHENKHKNHTNHLHTLRKCSITWLQFVLSTRSKCWLICHSMACTAIYSSRDSDLINSGGSSQDYGKTVAVLCRFIPSKPLLLQWLFSLPLVAQWINFCLMYTLIVLG